MKRREALKTLVIASGGLLVFPSCLGWKPEDVSVDSSTFTSAEQSLISAVADTFIPARNDSPSALSTETDKFLIRLFDECYEKDVRDNIKLQLSKLDEKAVGFAGKSFADCSQTQREALLLAFSESGDEDENNFFQLIKRETVRGFQTSKVVMQDYYGYRVVPAHYDGNVDVDA